MREKPDHYAIRAKKEGYPARSVYKLEEIQNKTQMIKKGYNVLDIGAAPGSWSLYTAKILQARVHAVDLKPLNLEKRPDNLSFQQGDIFNPAVQSALRDAGPFDCLISDAAPGTTGSRTVDTGRSFSLVEGILGLCPALLKPGGSFTAKIFQGGDEQELLSRMRIMFGSARMFKPKACRKDSFETFLIGSDYRGADNISAPGKTGFQVPG